MYIVAVFVVPCDIQWNQWNHLAACRNKDYDMLNHHWDSEQYRPSMWYDKMKPSLSSEEKREQMLLLLGQNHNLGVYCISTLQIPDFCVEFANQVCMNPTATITYLVNPSDVLKGSSQVVTIRALGIHYHNTKGPFCQWPSQESTKGLRSMHLHDKPHFKKMTPQFSPCFN